MGMDDLGCERGYVVVPPQAKRGDEPYPIRPHLVVMSLPRWIRELRRLAKGRK
jgi:hypothetical protein